MTMTTALIVISATHICIVLLNVAIVAWAIVSAARDNNA